MVPTRQDECNRLQEQHHEAQQNEELCKQNLELCHQNLTAANEAYYAAHKKSKEAHRRLHTCCQFNEDRKHIWEDNKDKDGNINTFYPKKCITCKENGASALWDNEDNAVYFQSKEELNDRNRRMEGLQWWQR